MAKSGVQGWHTDRLGRQKPDYCCGFIGDPGFGRGAGHRRMSVGRVVGTGRGERAGSLWRVSGRATRPRPAQYLGEVARGPGATADAALVGQAVVEGRVHHVAGGHLRAADVVLLCQAARQVPRVAHELQGRVETLVSLGGQGRAAAGFTSAPALDLGAARHRPNRKGAGVGEERKGWAGTPGRSGSSARGERESCGRCWCAGVFGARPTLRRWLRTH